MSEIKIGDKVKYNGKSLEVWAVTTDDGLRLSNGVMVCASELDVESKIMEILKEIITTKEIIYKKGSFTVKLIRRGGQMFKIEIQGGANFTEKEAIDLQHALNKFTGHI